MNWTRLFATRNSGNVLTAFTVIAILSCLHCSTIYILGEYPSMWKAWEKSIFRLVVVYSLNLPRFSSPCSASLSIYFLIFLQYSKEKIKNKIGSYCFTWLIRWIKLRFMWSLLPNMQRFNHLVTSHKAPFSLQNVCDFIVIPISILRTQTHAHIVHTLSAYIWAKRQNICMYSLRANTVIITTFDICHCFGIFTSEKKNYLSILNVWQIVYILILDTFCFSLVWS